MSSPPDPRLSDAHDYGRRQDGGCLVALLLLALLVSAVLLRWLL